MNNETKHEKPFRNFFLSFAQAMDYDPMFEMQKRIRELEEKIKDLESNDISKFK